MLYVWFDALINYISALGYPDESGLMARYWPADAFDRQGDRAFPHADLARDAVVGRAAPHRSACSRTAGCSTDGEKMSKSLGNVVDPFNLVEQFGADAVRYFLFREAPFGSDFSISFEKLRMRHNSDLGNDLGNLLRRSLAMLAKYRNGLVPAASESQLGERFADIGAQVHEHVMALRFREALDTIWELITALNREIDERKPWDLFKHERGVELDALLYDLCEGLRFAAILLFPFMPVEGDARCGEQLGLAGTPDGALARSPAVGHARREHANRPRRRALPAPRTARGLRPGSRR